MAKIIAISNQKGGVGKTTTSVNLAACLGKMGKKTLLVDADPQGNATSGVAIDKSKVKFSTYSILVDGAKAEQCVLTTPYDNLHILPSSLDLAAAELEIAEKPHREALLKNALLPIKQYYDYIIIDCPSSLGLITANALTVADTFLVPIQCEYFVDTPYDCKCYSYIPTKNEKTLIISLMEEYCQKEENMSINEFIQSMQKCESMEMSM